MFSRHAPPNYEIKNIAKNILALKCFTLFSFQNCVLPMSSFVYKQRKKGAKFRNQLCREHWPSQWSSLCTWPPLCRGRDNCRSPYPSWPAQPVGSGHFVHTSGDLRNPPKIEIIDELSVKQTAWIFILLSCKAKALRSLIRKLEGQNDGRFIDVQLYNYVSIDVKENYPLCRLMVDTASLKKLIKS